MGCFAYLSDPELTFILGSLAWIFVTDSTVCDTVVVLAVRDDDSICCSFAGLNIYWLDVGYFDLSAVANVYVCSLALTLVEFLCAISSWTELDSFRNV